jgi:hypothetical protein
MILVLEASWFLIKVNLSLSAKVIAELGTPYFDYHEETIRGLAKQKVDSRIGFILLLLSFILQMVNSLWPMSTDEFSTDKNGALISILFCIIVGTIAFLYSNHSSKRLFEQSMQIIKNRRK